MLYIEVQVLATLNVGLQIMDIFALVIMSLNP